MWATRLFFKIITQRNNLSIFRNLTINRVHKRVSKVSSWRHFYGTIAQAKIIFSQSIALENSVNVGICALFFLAQVYG